MKANFTCKLKIAFKGLVLSAMFGIGTSAIAQQSTAPLPFQGGMTYYVDGVGSDVVAPKDTFVNLSGTYTATLPYTTPYAISTGILSALTVNGLDSNTIGTVNIILTASYNGVIEQNAIALGTASNSFPYQGGNKPIVMKPAPGTNITITALAAALTGTGSLFRFNGTQFFTIDGESTPGQRNLTFQVPAAATTTTLKVIDIIPNTSSGCQSVYIKNCNILGSSSSTAINTFAGIFLGSASNGASSKRSQDIRIENNFIGAVQYGVNILGLGSVGGSQDFGLSIRNNTIGGQTGPSPSGPVTNFIGGSSTAGIQISAQANALIDNNVIRNSIPTSGGFRAIALTTTSGTSSLDSSILISRNRIYNITTTIASQGSYGIRMNLGTHTSPMNIRMENNTIANISCTGGTTTQTGVTFPIGILIEDLSSNVGVSMIHNSINLYGSTIAAGSFSACVALGTNVGSITGGGVILQNNILANRMGRASANSTGATNYGVMILSATANVNPFIDVNGVSRINNNNFYINTFDGGNAFIAYANSKPYVSINHLRAFAGMTAGNSTTAIPPFLSDTLLQLDNTSASVISNTGAPVSSIPVDISGNLRSATAPSVGAYEFTSIPANVNGPLVGGSTYLVGGTSSWPKASAPGTGTFANMSEAITYLNAYGTTGGGQVILELQAAYTNEGNNYMPAFIDFANASPNRPVIIRPASGVSDTLTIPNVANFNFCGVLRFIGARFITVDGLNRNLTLLMPANANNATARVVALTPSDLSPTTDIIITNCVITGNSTTTAINTFAGIFLGDYKASTSALTGLNNNHIFSNNLIQAVRTGIYLRGYGGTLPPAGGLQDQSIYIAQNTIGGTIGLNQASPTTYIGGAASAAGILLKSVSGSIIDGNTIRNSASTISNDFRGIDMDALNEGGKDTNLFIVNNRIYNLVSSTQSCAGIRINLATDTLRKITLSNNSIARIQGVGSGAGISASNPTGILIDATGGTVNNLGIELYYNTVQLTGSTLTNSSGSACLFLGSNIRSNAVALKNNLFVNKLGRAAVSSPIVGTVYVIASGMTVAGINPFTAVNNNVYYVNAANSLNYLSVINSINHVSLPSWRAYLTGSTGGDSSSYTYNVHFSNDSMPDVVVSTAGAVTYAAAPISTVTRDINGTARFGSVGYNLTPAGTTPCAGAVEFAQTFSPLVGGTTYQINGTQNPPTKTNPTVGSFSTVGRALRYLIANGVDGTGAPANPITLLITSGYAGETPILGDTAIMALTEYPKMNANRVVILKSDAPRTLSTLFTPGTYGPTSSFLRFSGASYITIDGSINNSYSRDLTITLPAVANTFDNTLKVIDFIPYNVASTNITIKNCNIIGNSTTGAISNYAGIFLGGNYNYNGTQYVTSTFPSNPIIAGNNSNNFTNNFIGGVRYGIYMRGASTVKGQQDRGNVVHANNIGGDVNIGAGVKTNYFGGADASAGIFLSAQSNVVVDSNTVKNNLRAFQLNRGIELSNASGTASVDSNVTIRGNNIYNISSTTAAAYGVYMNLGAGDTLRAVNIVNNWISGISSIGTGSTPSISFANPSGIYVEGSGSGVLNLGLNIWFNTINMASGTGLTAANSASSCVSFHQLIKGGVSLKNNILQNRLVRGAGATTSNSLGVLVGSSTSIFSSIDNNNYFVNATGPGTNNLMAFNTTATPTYLNTIPAIAGFTRQDTSSISFVTQFTNTGTGLASDTILDIPLTTPSVLTFGGSFNPSVTNDIFGRGRGLNPTIGAVEFSGTFVDSVAPRVYSYTANVCGYGPFKIDIRAYERNVLTDTLYYKVNGGPALPLQATSVNGTQRIYTIPSQLPNSIILFRSSVNDASGRNGIYPAGGNWDTLATSVTNFPYGYGFDGPNVNKWTVESIQGFAFGGWILSSAGSLANPNFSTAFSGVKVAMFPAATLASGTASRLVSPCFDVSNATLPTLRFWVSQNADLPTRVDSIVIRVNSGFGWGFSPETYIIRPNTNFIFPGWKQVDVCLAPYVGSTIRIGFEAYSKNGNNVMIDSVMLIDNYINSSVTPKTNTICAYDSVSLTVANSIPTISYSIYDYTKRAIISNAYLGNGGNLVVKAANPQSDSLSLGIFANNTFSGSTSCFNLMTDTVKVYTKLFKNGPFVVQGTPFAGAFNAGVPLNPDGAVVGDTLTYNIVPPSGLNNADFGTKWTITAFSLKTVTNQPAISSTYTPPTAFTNGTYVLMPKQLDQDSIFIMKLTFRLLPTNCDSTVIRYIRVTSAPLTSFTNGGKDTACRGAAVPFVSTTTLNLFTIPYVYAWDFGDGTTSTNSSAFKVYTTAGTYTVKLKVTNSAGLATTLSKTFTVQASPSSSFTNSRPCNGDSVSFTNTTNGAISYMWTATSPPTATLPGGVSVSSTRTNPNFYMQTPNGDTGTFRVMLVSTNNLGCTDTSTRNVQVFAKPVASFSITNHCLGAKATFTNNSSIIGASNSIGSTWYPGNGDTILSFSPTYYFPSNGTFTVRLKVTSNYGCVDSASQVVVVYDKPRTGFTYDTSTTCQGAAVNITDTSKYLGVAGSNKMLYLWTFGDNSVPSTDFNPIKIYGVKGSYQVRLIATDTVHFCTDSTVKTINISETPVAQFESPFAGCVNAPVSFTNKTSVGAGQTVTYLWNFGDTQTDTSTSPSHTYTSAGSKAITLKATALNGCSSISSKVIPVSSSPSITYAKDSLDCFSYRFRASSNVYSSYVWNAGDGSSLITAYRDTLPRHLYTTKGWHVVMLTVTDSNNCSGSYKDSVYTFCSVGIAETAGSPFSVNIYPNPFINATNVAYTLENAAKVHIKVFDMLGRTVADMDKGLQPAGKQVAELGADQLIGNSAAYMVRIQIDDAVITKQIIRQK